MAEARAAGVRRFAVNGCWEGDWDTVSKHSLVPLLCSLRSLVSHAHARAAQVGQLAADNAEVVPNFGLHPWCAVLARSPAARRNAGGAGGA